jgi:hypothetical protein
MNVSRTAAREAGAGARIDEATVVLADAATRDARADERDARADERERVASLDAFLHPEADHYGAAMRARRASAIDRSEARPTGRHRPTTDRSSATADGPLGFADLRTTPGMSEHNAGSTSRDAPPAFERSGQPSRPGGPVISPYGAGGWLRSLKLGPPAASGSFRESGLRDCEMQETSHLIRRVPDNDVGRAEALSCLDQHVERRGIHEGHTRSVENHSVAHRFRLETRLMEERCRCGIDFTHHHEHGHIVTVDQLSSESFDHGDILRELAGAEQAAVSGEVSRGSTSSSSERTESPERVRRGSL